MTAGSDDLGASLRAVATMFAELGAELAAETGKPPASRRAFEALTETALRRVAGADAASVTILRDDRFTTASATDQRAVRADRMQYELQSGPCVDAILDDAIYRPLDLRTDDRWPTYGEKVSAELGFLSMLSYRLGIDPALGDVISGLNLYSERANAFDDTAVEVGLLLATHGAVVTAAAINSERAAHLEQALESSREIGMAMGVLMNQHKLTRSQAFDLLRIASQNSNRKIRDIATEVVDTGVLAYTAGRR